MEMFVFVINRKVLPSLVAPKPVELVGQDIALQLCSKRLRDVSGLRAGRVFAYGLAAYHIFAAGFFVDADVCNRHACLAGYRLCAGHPFCLQAEEFSLDAAFTFGALVGNEEINPRVIFMLQGVTQESSGGHQILLLKLVEAAKAQEKLFAQRAGHGVIGAHHVVITILGLVTIYRQARQQLPVAGVPQQDHHAAVAGEHVVDHRSVLDAAHTFFLYMRVAAGEAPHSLADYVGYMQIISLRKTFHLTVSKVRESFGQVGADHRQPVLQHRPEQPRHEAGQDMVDAQGQQRQKDCRQKDRIDRQCA